jgi:kynureninase
MKIIDYNFNNVSSSAKVKYTKDRTFALQMDESDPLKNFRDKFHIPKQSNGLDTIYFCGNSLGLQPKTTRTAVLQELEDWAALGVEGHFHGAKPWLQYNTLLSGKMARIVGAKPSEVVVMNTLTVNLHLMMVSFYRPTKKRYKILIDWNPFPSDRYAVSSQIRYHGFDPSVAIIEPKPKGDSALIETPDLLNIIEKQGDSIALVMIGGLNYYSGQLYDLKKITEKAHKKGCLVGFDLAHAAGNVKLNLHDMDCDFAVWCTYKYLNAGPGALAGCFVHERYANTYLPRFEGWWGNDLGNRFQMLPDFTPSGGAESWQLSNPPVLSLAAIKAALDIFDEAGMDNLIQKSKQLTAYLEFLIKQIPTDKIRVITPENPDARGCQLSIQVKGANKSLFQKITEGGVIGDWREPDVIRVAPVPLYNRFIDVWQFSSILEECVKDIS